MSPESGKEKLISFLGSTGLVGPAAAAAIANRFHPKALARHEYFLRAGAVADEYFFLDSGFMRAYVLDPAGNEVTTGFVGSQGVAFEVSSFFTRQPSQENMQALVPCTGWVLSFAQLNQLFHELPEFREFGRSVLVRGFAALKTRMLSMITETAETRYAHLVATRPDIVQQAPLKYIASYLGITDTSLSRIRKEIASK